MERLDVVLLASDLIVCLSSVFEIVPDLCEGHVGDGLYSSEIQTIPVEQFYAVAWRIAVLAQRNISAESTMNNPNDRAIEESES